MAEVDFSSVESAEAWFNTQTPEVRSVAANRAALRYLALLCEAPTKYFEQLTLSAFRYVLISAVRGIGNPEKTRSLENAGQRAIELGEAAFKATGLHSGRPVSAYAISGMSIGASLNPSTAALATVISPDNRDAALADFRNLKLNLSQEALWLGVPVPRNVLNAHQQFLKILSKDSSWLFFRDWYLGLWTGSFENWPLATKVALINDKFWAAGLDAIATEIERIQAGHAALHDLPRPENVPELERTKLLQHVKRLLASPDMTALAAEGAAEILDRAIRQYLQDAPANCLPDDLIHLEALPSLFRSISTAVKSNQKADVKEEKLADEIAALNAKIAQLEASLKAASAKTVHGLFYQNALKAAGAAFGAGVVGSLGLGLAHFFGEWPGDMTLENLRGYLFDLSTAEPLAEPSALPPVTGV